MGAQQKYARKKAKGQVILVIDMINDFKFPDGRKLAKQAVKIATPLSQLLHRARQAKIPIVYVNDNFGQWRSDLNAQIKHCKTNSELARPILDQVLPAKGDYYVLKPKHSGFYASPLALLLENFHAKTLILTGISTESCVLFTANDAYVRDYDIVVASDCVASIKPQAKTRALQQMEEALHARVVKSSSLRFA